MALLLLFFDGIGVGRADPQENPFAAIDARRLGALFGSPDPEARAFVPLDATLGVPGLPQSATGQTTLLTGVNAAAHAGRHMVGIPGPTLRPLLERESLFLKLDRGGVRATSANAYTPQHLEARRPRLSASTRAVLAAGLALRMWDEDGVAGAALFHDYTGESLRRFGLSGPRRDAQDAGAILARLLDAHDFVFYEYFLTDLMAHRGGWDDQVSQARRAEELVSAAIERIDPTRHTVVVTSDHGNLEDARHSRHTLNPVPFLAWGRSGDALASGVREMTDVTPAILSVLARTEGTS
jgi:2,3-bisphosphoglycerate-independent phosphoglycerate mutase